MATLLLLIISPYVGLTSYETSGHYYFPISDKMKMDRLTNLSGMSKRPTRRAPTIQDTGRAQLMNLLFSFMGGK